VTFMWDTVNIYNYWYVYAANLYKLYTELFSPVLFVTVHTGMAFSPLQANFVKINLRRAASVLVFLPAPFCLKHRVLQKDNNAILEMPQINAHKRR